MTRNVKEREKKRHRDKDTAVDGEKIKYISQMKWIASFARLWNDYIMCDLNKPTKSTAPQKIQKNKFDGII